MSIPSFEYIWRKDSKVKPRIHMLAVRDKNQLDGPVIAYIVVERTESIKYQENGQIYEASICLDYQLVSVERDLFPIGKSFCGGYSKFRNRVSLTNTSISEGAVFLDLDGLYGQRIGTYLMNEIVAWVKQWPDAEVDPIKLSEGQAGPNNKDRRNRFYEAFGLLFDFTDDSKKEGHSRIMRASVLKENLKWQQNIDVVGFIPFIEDLKSKINKQNMDLEHKVQAIDRLNSENRSARDHPIKWGLKWTWYNNIHNFVVLCVVGLIGFVVWVRL